MQDNEVVHGHTVGEASAILPQKTAKTVQRKQHYAPEKLNFQAMFHRNELPAFGTSSHPLIESRHTDK